jgi:hypothetical protein
MKRLLAVVLILAAAVPAAASAALAQKSSLRLDRSAVLNGVVLEAGDYRIELAPSLTSVKLLQRHRTLVTAPCKVSMAEGRLLGDAIHYRSRTDGRDEIVRIVFAGSRLSIEIVPEASDTKEQPIAKVEEDR